MVAVIDILSDGRKESAIEIYNFDLFYIVFSVYFE